MDSSMFLEVDFFMTRMHLGCAILHPCALPNLGMKQTLEFFMSQELKSGKRFSERNKKVGFDRIGILCVLF